MGKGGERPGMNSRTGNSSWGSGKGSEAKTTVVRGVKRKEKDSNGIEMFRFQSRKYIPYFFQKPFCIMCFTLNFFGRVQWFQSAVPESKPLLVKIRHFEC